MSRFLQAGGTLPPDALYLPRQADRELLSLLRARSYCHVLAPRQMGKSSLRVRVQGELEAAGIHVVSIDLTRIGTQDAATEQFYFSLLRETAVQLDLPPPEEDWQAQGARSPVERFGSFLRDAVALKPREVVLFIDEVDALLGLQTASRDDLLSALRGLFNGRADDPVCRRLTVCLIGAALPSDLMQDEGRTPFNVGRRVLLEDFSRGEIAALAPALSEAGFVAEPILDAVFALTSGHPYLTLRLCESLIEQGPVGDRGQVDALVRELFLQPGRHPDPSLSHVARHFTRADARPRTGAMLGLYGRLRSGEEIVYGGQDLVQEALLLTGIAAVERAGAQAVLRPRCAIFAEAFSPAWVAARMAERRLAEPLRRWAVAGRRTEDLLIGQALRDAVAWSRGREDVTAQEREYLDASLDQERRAALRRQLVRLLGLAALFLLVGLGVAIYQYRVAEEARWAEQGMRAAAVAQLPGHRVEASLISLEAVFGSNGTGPPGIAALPPRIMEGLVAATIELVGFRPLPKLPAAVTGLAVSPDGRRVFTGAEGGVLRVYDAQEGRLLLSIGRPGKGILGLDLSSDGRRVASADNLAARVWDFESGRLLAEHILPRGKSGPLWTKPMVLFHPNGQSVIAAFSFGSLIYYAPDGPPQEIALQGRPFSMAISQDRTLLAVGEHNGTIEVFQLPTLRRTLVLRAPTPHFIWAIALSPDGRRLLTYTDEDDAALEWDLARQVVVRRLAGHSSRIAHIAYALGGRQAATAGWDGVVRIWDMDTGKAVAVLEGHHQQAYRVAFLPDGQHLLSTDNDGCVRLWDLRQRVFLPLVGHTAEVEAASFSPEGGRVVTASLDGTVGLWEAQGGRPLWRSPRQSSGFTAASFSPDGNTVASGSMDGTLRWWSAAAGELLWEAPAHRSNVASVAFSSDGKQMASASWDRSVRLWDVKTRTTLQDLTVDGDKATGVSFSADGGRIYVSGAFQGTIWETRSGTQLVRFPNPDSHWLSSAAFSPDGKRLLSGSGDHFGLIYDASNGARLATLEAHADGVTSASYSPDGRRALTASMDWTARIWDLDTAQALFTLPGHGGGIQSAGFAPDGTRVVTASDDRTARIYPVTPLPYVTFACSYWLYQEAVPPLTRERVADLRARCRRYLAEVGGPSW